MNLTLPIDKFPLRLRPQTRMTDDELMRFCAENEAVRIEREPNGEILMRPANSKTSTMNLSIGRLLDEWAEADGRGVAFDSSGGFTLPDSSMRNPDAAWMINSRWNAMSDDEQSSYAPACPDFVIELRSPSDRIPDLQAKMQQWIANGAQLGWLIDPSRKVVEVYRAGQEPEIHEQPTSVQGSGPVMGFDLVMARVWG